MKKIRFILIIVVITCVFATLISGIIKLKNSSSPDLIVIGKAPSFSFINQKGETISNKNYNGKIYVVDFFFTSCPSICPLMTNHLVKVQQHFTNEQIAFASFSIDPKHDTPEILMQYAKNHKITNPNWHLLTSDKATVMKLANEGFNIYASSEKGLDGGFEHSGKMALIDTQGNIVSRKDKQGNPIIYYDGLSDEGISQLIEDISQLLSSSKK